MLAEVQFRFEAESHTYIALDTGAELPHITGMLEQTGWIDDTWYTEDSKIRGTAVHSMAADFDLGAFDIEGYAGAYRGWLIAHRDAMAVLKPKFCEIEMARVHPEHRFGGRPDRVAKLFTHHCVIDLKSGAKERSHGIQTALQVILASAFYPLPAPMWGRWTEYLNKDGGWSLRPHDDRRDFDEAYRIIRTCCT